MAAGPPVKQQLNNNVTHGFVNFCDICHVMWAYLVFVNLSDIRNLKFHIKYRQNMVLKAKSNVQKSRNHSVT